MNGGRHTWRRATYNIRRIWSMPEYIHHLWYLFFSHFEYHFYSSFYFRSIMAFASSLRTSSMRRYSWSYGGGKCQFQIFARMQHFCACSLQALKTIFFLQNLILVLLLQVRHPCPHLHCLLLLPALHNYVGPIRFCIYVLLLLSLAFTHSILSCLAHISLFVTIIVFMNSRLRTRII